MVIDVSNVCKDARIGAGSGNLLPMLDAVAAHLRVKRPRAILVLDKSLLTGTGANPLSKRERAILQLVVDECRTLVHGGPFVVVSYADPELLAQALRHDARVVTNDHLRDHYRDHAWLKDGDGRFLGWSCRAAKVTIRPVGKIATGQWTDSNVKQTAEIKRLPDHAERELFDWWLSCDNVRCRKYRTRLVFGDPEGLRLAFHREVFVCSECGEPAARDGRRPAGRDVYVIWGTDTQVATYLVAEGESLTVGAGPQAAIDVFREPGGIVSGLIRPTEQQRARVDALHCRIHCSDGQLTVTDLGSRYGTCVLRMQQAEVANVAALTPAVPARLRRGDVAMLGEVVRLRTSGRPLPYGVPVGGA